VAGWRRFRDLGAVVVFVVGLGQYTGVLGGRVDGALLTRMHQRKIAPPIGVGRRVLWSWLERAGVPDLWAVASAAGAKQRPLRLGDHSSEVLEGDVGGLGSAAYAGVEPVEDGEFVGVNSKSNTSKFSAMRAGRTDLGIAERPS
jgi:hypothetical protein